MDRTLLDISPPFASAQPSEAAVLQAIIVAMTCVENGIKAEEAPVAAIEQGWKLAFPDAKMQKLKD
ncbi:MAG: hypothetical protein IKN19_04160 [Bacteroidaceae bacterium]|nr:hypothetical protein [Bacteroidaceae bacterium]